MLPTTLSPKVIRALNDLAALLCDADLHTPSREQLATNKAVIEAILPPADHGYVTGPYVMRVSVAYAYAKTHYRDTSHSLLSDIEQGKAIKATDISDYKFKLEER